MVFYKGAVTYKDFQEMPIVEILNLKTSAEKINRDLIKEYNKPSKR